MLMSMVSDMASIKHLGEEGARGKGDSGGRMGMKCAVAFSPQDVTKVILCW